MAQAQTRRTPPRWTRPINKAVALASGRRWLPVWALVEHTGRRSGRAYRTPVAVIATPDAFYIALPWGRGTDWVRNLTTAGGGRVVWRGRHHVVSSPAFVDKAEVLAAARTPLRQILERWSGSDFLRLSREAERGAH